MSVISRRRSVREQVEQTLRARIRPDDIRGLADEAFLLHMDADTAAIRDWLSDSLEEGESALVVEFEQ